MRFQKITKFQKMKNLNILLAFIITFMFFGCEKEQTTNPNSTALNKTKSNYSIEKSEEDLFTEVMGFIEATTNHTLIENLNAQDALLFTEAAMNYRLTNDEHLPSESKSFSLNYEVEVLTDGVDLYIEANEIQAMNDYIYDFIYQEAEDYVFENGNKDGKIISIVDFKIENLNAGLYSIAVEYTFSNFSSTPLPASCDVNLSWYPVMNDGGCNGNPAVLAP